MKSGNDGFMVGVSVTALIHLGLFGALMASTDDGCTGPEASAETDRFADSVVIEAALAIKEVKPKSKQPVKLKKKKFAPDERGVARDLSKKKTKREDKHKVPVLPDEVDFEETLRKNRTQDPETSSTGADEKPTEGSATGSIWGTEREAKGHKYVGELKGRIHSVWELPSLETGTGTVLGCIRLNDKGKIIDSAVRRRSENTNLNRSVDLALKRAPAMEDPVPDELKELLTVKGICLRFTP